jgi:hypothetical protein
MTETKPVFRVVNDRGAVVLETDDWIEACDRALSRNWPRGDALHVCGTHPTHDWDDQRPRRCRGCDGWDNSSYGSQAPCGYDWSHECLVTAVERELAARQADR